MHVIPDHLPGSLLRRFENIPDRLLRIMFRRGSEIQRVHVIQIIASRRAQDWRLILSGGLSDSSPAIRRHSARALGAIADQRDAAQLMKCTGMERCDTVRFNLGLAAIQCGIDAAELWGVLTEAAERRMRCAYGDRATGSSAGWGSAVLEDLWVRGELANTSPKYAGRSAVAKARVGIAGNPDDREAVLALGLWAEPQDAEHLGSLWRAAGRRMRLTLCRAMGLHGDPRFYRRLVECLESVDVDPGHGFAMRTEAAIALGRLGLRRGVRPLIRALETEALEHEGRPGAGMGIQHSVRIHILAALGELQAAPHVLRTYLGNTHGSAQGGFYLPAMDALWKCGDSAGLRPLVSHNDILAANALGVLRAIEGAEAIQEWVQDARPMVAAVAAP